MADRGSLAWPFFEPKHRELAGQLDATLLHPGQHLGGEPEMIRLLFPVAGIYGVGDHGPSRSFGDQLFQTGPFTEPFADALRIELTSGQLIEERCDILPFGAS